MNAGLVVSNTSALIALERVGQLDLLQQLYGNVVIPPAVAQEAAPRLVLPNWIMEHALTQPLDPLMLAASLGLGETEAIGLALELNADRVVLDDAPARRLAKSLGLPSIGTLGILLAAKRCRILPAVRPVLDALIRSGFYVAPKLYQRVLSDAGENP